MKKTRPELTRYVREAFINATEIEAEAVLEYSAQRGQIGFCHIFWPIQKRILKEKYAVNWKSPSEDNLQAMYD